MFTKILELFKVQKKNIDVLYQNMNIPDKQLKSIHKDYRDQYFVGHGLIIRFP